MNISGKCKFNSKFYAEPEVIDIDEDEDEDPLETRPPPVNNNKPAHFTVVSGPRGPILVSLGNKNSLFLFTNFPPIFYSCGI